MRNCRNFGMALFLIAGMMLVGRAYADVTAEAKKAIRTAYVQEDAATSKKDVKGLFAHYHPAWEMTVKSAKSETVMNLAQMKQSITQQLATITSITSKTTIQTFTSKGKDVLVRFKAHGDIVFADPQTQKPSRIVVDEVGEDTWTLSGKNWLKRKSKTLQQSSTKDGKSIGP